MVSGEIDHVDMHQFRSYEEDFCEIVGLFTGRYEIKRWRQGNINNQKKIPIYEGDVVSVSNWGSEHYIIVYVEKECAFKLLNPLNGATHWMHTTLDISVKGNIYEEQYKDYQSRVREFGKLS